MEKINKKNLEYWNYYYTLNDNIVIEDNNFKCVSEKNSSYNKQ